MTAQANAIPTGYHAVTACLVVKDADRTIDFYKKAFNAQVLNRMNCPDSDKLMHAELQIGDSRIMLSGEMSEQGCVAPASTKGTSGCSIYLYVQDVDTTFQQATKAGGKVIMQVEDAFWGDRMGTISDPSGHKWSIATHKQDLTPQQIAQGAEAFFTSKAGSR